MRNTLLETNGTGPGGDQTQAVMALDRRYSHYLGRPLNRFEPGKALVDPKKHAEEKGFGASASALAARLAPIKVRVCAVREIELCSLFPSIFPVVFPRFYLLFFPALSTSILRKTDLTKQSSLTWPIFPMHLSIFHPPFQAERERRATAKRIEDMQVRPRPSGPL